MTAAGPRLPPSSAAADFRPPWAAGVPTVLPGLEEAFYLDAEARRARQCRREELEEVPTPSPVAPAPWTPQSSVSSRGPPPALGAGTPRARQRPASAGHGRGEYTEWHSRSGRSGAQGEEGPGLSRCHLLYQQAIFASRESAQLEREIKILRQREEMRECTFKPKLFPNRKLSSAAPQPRNFDVAVARMRAASQQRARQHKERERIPCGENYERLRRLGTQPFTCYYRERGFAKRPPLLYIDVSVGRGRTGRIGLHEGDDLRVLSRNFAKAFQLDREAESKLEGLLQQAYEEQVRSQEAEQPGNPLTQEVSLGDEGYENDGLEPWDDMASRDTESEFFHSP